MPQRPGHNHRRASTLRPHALPAILTTAVLAIAALVAGPLSPSAHAITNTSRFKGVNWADQRDNFVNGPVVPSGLSTSDSYATTYAKATAIVSGFQTNLGANTVRFGMNPDTTSSAWWNSYIGAIDATLAKGMNVMIAPWAYPGACACVTDTTAFYRMWDTVINRYLSNPNMYFEIYNEPHSYSDSAWDNFAAGFVAHYPNVPRGRIVVAGSGSDAHLATVGADPRLSGTLLSLHLYSVFGISHTTEAAWVTELNNQLHGYGSRTVITEFGVPMSTGVNYNGARDGDNNVSYFYGMTDTIRSEGLGSIYWPGLRIGDSWSMEQLHGSGTDLSLTTVNASGLDRLEYAWGGTGSGGGSNTVTVTSPGPQTDIAQTAIDGVQIHAADSASGQSLTYTATGLPAGLSISTSGLIAGTPTTAGTYNVTVAAKDSTGATGSASFTWTITAAGTGGRTCQVSYVKNEWGGGFTANLTVTNTGTSTVNGWTVAWSFPGDQKVTNAWNANVTQSGSAVSATNVGYNAAIAPGGNVQFGLQGTWTNDDTSPAGFTLNGTTCS